MRTPLSQRARPQPHRSLRAFTLIELVIVVGILVVVAVLVIAPAGGVYGGGGDQLGVLVRTTHATIITAREAIDGPAERPGFVQDLGRIPIDCADLFRVPPALDTGVPVDGTPLERFDPMTKRGWNGPYLLRATCVYRRDVEKGFLPEYGEDQDPGIIDGWGRPIILQVPRDQFDPSSPPLPIRTEFARFVSAGPNGRIETNLYRLDPNLNVPEDVGDDVVVYLFRTNGPR